MSDPLPRIVALALCVSLAACGGGDAGRTGDDATAETPAADTAAAPTADDETANAPGEESSMTEGDANAADGAPGATDTPVGAGLPADGEDPRSLPSGIRLSTLAKGQPGGAKPLAGDKVKVHYTGWLTDGTKFDSSRDRGLPASFAIGPGLIEGWNLVLVTMVPGDRVKAVIPPEHAYGADGRPPVIPPDSTLVFDIELLDVKASPRFTAPNPENQTALESGTKYEVLVEGEGDPPGDGDTIVFHFALFNADGVLVESTYDAPQPPAAPLDKMPMPFLKEIPRLMKPGSTWLCEVPSDQAMGDRGMGPALPPGAVSIWKLELLKVATPMPVPAFARPADEDLESSPSGLRWQVLSDGEGDRPAMGDTVEVHYAGWLEDGTVFDSSYGRGLPARFQLGGVIAGWNEGLQKIAPGGEMMLVIPPKLAYGNRGTGNIPPNSTLIFKVKLLSVNPTD